MGEAAQAGLQRDDERSFLARCGPLVIAITRRPPVVEGIRKFGNLIRDATKESAAGAYVFVALGADRPRLDEEVRKEIVVLWRELGEAMNVAVWVRRGSFAGALQRSFITAVSLLRVRSTPLKVVSGPDGAYGWFLSLNPELERHGDEFHAAVQRGLTGSVE